MRQEIADLKRQLILEEASRHFSEHGYDATQVSLIAKEASVSIGTIYGFFESKEGLFEAHILAEMRKAHEVIKTLFEQSSASPKEHLKAVISYYFKTLESKKKSVQEILLSSPLRMGEYCHNLCSPEDNPTLEMYKLLALEFERLHSVQPLAITDFLQLSISFRNAAAGYIERWALLDDIVLSDKVDECLELFLKGVIV